MPYKKNAVIKTLCFYSVVEHAVFKTLSFYSVLENAVFKTLCFYSVLEKCRIQLFPGPSLGLNYFISIFDLYYIDEKEQVSDKKINASAKLLVHVDITRFCGR